ncbi:alpha/beta hydrolase [Mycolicibacterium mageritense]
MVDAERIEFDAEGVRLRGLFYAADDPNGSSPAVVMAHGLAGQVTHFLTDFAEDFANAGLSTLLYDHRGWGMSDSAPGEPRNETDPYRQIRDYQHAVTYLQNRSDVDGERIGAWGTSLSAGHVMVLGAIDRRVKAIAAQVPFISGFRSINDLIRIDMRQQMYESFAADRRDRARGAAPAYVPIASEDPMGPSALPTPDSFAHFLGPGGVAERDPDFDNRITSRSLENLYGYEPGGHAPFISPTPLLMIVALGDQLASSDLALAAYQTAAHPKRLVTLDCGHFDAYTGPHAETSKQASRRFFREHLDASEARPGDMAG